MAQMTMRPDGQTAKPSRKRRRNSTSAEDDVEAPSVRLASVPSNPRKRDHDPEGFAVNKRVQALRSSPIQVGAVFVQQVPVGSSILTRAGPPPTSVKPVHTKKGQ